MPLQSNHRWFTMRRIQYKGILVCSPRCSKRRRIDEAVINALVAVDQRATNCSEELMSPSVVHSQLFALSRACRFTVSKLPTLELFRSTRTATARQENPPLRRPRILPHSNQ
ncbi:hypothetical protein TNCV_4264451 [Trichonephila clavipes]|nr:hypothetical protein TNCV_4264451 [Trichonephila clavipes]